MLSLNKMKQTRSFLLVLVLVAMIFGGAMKPIGAAATRVHVFVGLTGGGDYLNNEYNAIAAKWNDQHQDVKLVFDFHFYPNNGNALAQAQLIRELAGKQPPDII